MRNAEKQETPVYHGVRKGSFSQRVRIEPAFEKWRDLNKEKKEGEGSSLWLCRKYLRNFMQHHKYPNRVPYVRNQWAQNRYSRREEEHGQEQGGRISHDTVICLMLVKHPSTYAANIVCHQ